MGKHQRKEIPIFSSVQFSRSVMSDSATPWTAAHQASLSITNSRSSFKLMSIVSVMPSSHLILCRPLLLLPPIPPSIKVFSNELTLHMRWPKYWSFRFSTIPSKEHPGLISFRMNWLDLLEVQGTPKSLLQHRRLLLWCKSYSAILPYMCVGTLSEGRYQVSIFSLPREKLLEIWVFTFLCHIALVRIMEMCR